MPMLAVRQRWYKQNPLFAILSIELVWLSKLWMNYLTISSKANNLIFIQISITHKNYYSQMSLLSSSLSCFYISVTLS